MQSLAGKLTEACECHSLILGPDNHKALDTFVVNSRAMCSSNVNDSFATMHAVRV